MIDFSMFAVSTIHYFFLKTTFALVEKKKKSQTQDILVTPILFLRHLLSASSVC